MARIEKWLFAGLAGVGLLSFAGQRVNDSFFESETARYRAGFSVDERRMIEVAALAAAERDETEAGDAPIRLNCPREEMLETFSSLPTSNLPAVLFDQRGEPLAIRYIHTEPARGVTRH